MCFSHIHVSDFYKIILEFTMTNWSRSNCMWEIFLVCSYLNIRLPTERFSSTIEETVLSVVRNQNNIAKIITPKKRVYTTLVHLGYIQSPNNKWPVIRRCYITSISLVRKYEAFESNQINTSASKRNLFLLCSRHLQGIEISLSTNETVVNISRESHEESLFLNSFVYFSLISALFMKIWFKRNS